MGHFIFKTIKSKGIALYKIHKILFSLCYSARKFRQFFPALFRDFYKSVFIPVEQVSSLYR